VSASAVIAVGVGDIAQLEYRLQAAASTLDASPVTLPSIGVQFKAPLPPHLWLPKLGVALRLGLPNQETDETTNTQFQEKVDDLYFVASLPLWGPLDWLTLHGGLRIGAATLTDLSTGQSVERTLYLPAGGWEAQVTHATRLVGELALVPSFDPMPGGQSLIGTAPFGRLGIRWAIVPWLTLDASFGYRLEIAKLTDPSPDGPPNAIVDWNMRLGAELFVPWGAIACRETGVFCP
jgi:hypothetical protein